MEGLLCSVNGEWFRRTELRQGYQLGSPVCAGAWVLPSHGGQLLLCTTFRSSVSPGNRATKQLPLDVLSKGRLFYSINTSPHPNHSTYLSSTFCDIRSLCSDM